MKRAIRFLCALALCGVFFIANAPTAYAHIDPAAASRFMQVAAGMERVPAAYAYIDPAATSYFIQVIAGLVIGAGVAVSVFWKKIKLWIKKGKMKRMEARIVRETEKKQTES